MKDIVGIINCKPMVDIIIAYGCVCTLSRSFSYPIIRFSKHYHNLDNNAFFVSTNFLSFSHVNLILAQLYGFFIKKKIDCMVWILGYLNVILFRETIWNKILLSQTLVICFQWKNLFCFEALNFNTKTKHMIIRTKCNFDGSILKRFFINLFRVIEHFDQIMQVPMIH